LKEFESFKLNLPSIFPFPNKKDSTEKKFRNSLSSECPELLLQYLQVRINGFPPSECGGICSIESGFFADWSSDDSSKIESHNGQQ
jgi:hypothetical protein